MSDLHDQAYENMRDLQVLRERELHRVYDDNQEDLQWLLNRRQRELGGAEVQPGRTVVRARGDRAGATSRDPGPSAAPSVYVRGDDGEPVAVYICPLCEAMSPEPGKCWRCYQ